MRRTSEAAGVNGFLDTNIFVRYLARDHPEHSPLAKQLFEQIERGEVRVFFTDSVIFETVFTLQSFYRVPRQEIADGLLRLLRLPGLMTADKALLRETFLLWVARSNLSYADCFHLVTAKSMGIDSMITFDRKMSIPGVNRVELPLE